MPDTINILEIKEDRILVKVKFDKVNNEFISHLKSACITSGRGFQVDESGVVMFKHLTTTKDAEGQARKLIRDTLSSMKENIGVTTDIELPNAVTPPSSIDAPFQNNNSLTAKSIDSLVEVVVTDVRMPFISMVSFMIKWAFAAIPALVILYVTSLVIAALFGHLLGTKY